MATKKMTKKEAIARLVSLDVAKWGECERAASMRMHARRSLGSAMMAIAHQDLNAVDEEMATAATAALSPADRRRMRAEAEFDDLA